MTLKEAVRKDQASTRITSQVRLQIREPKTLTSQLTADKSKVLSASGLQQYLADLSLPQISLDLRFFYAPFTGSV